MKKQKNKIFTFIFALIPGAGQMYMGFMKRGITLMSAAILICLVAILLNGPYFLFLMPLVWFFAFFDTWNLRALPEEEFMSQEDDFLTMNLPENFRPAKLFTGKYRPLVGIFAIFAGILILTSNLNSILSAFTPDWLYNVLDYAIRLTPRLLIGILIIVFGIRLVRGKKEEIFEEEIFEDEK